MLLMCARSTLPPRRAGTICLAPSACSSLVPSVADLHNHLDLNADAEWESAESHRRSRMFTDLVSENLRQQVGCTIDHIRLLPKVGNRIDHPQQFDDARDFIEVADFGLKARQAIQHDESGGFIAGLGVQFPSQFAYVGYLSTSKRAVAGDEDQVVGSDRSDVVGDGLWRRRQLETQIPKAHLDFRHCHTSSFASASFSAGGTVQREWSPAAQPNALTAHGGGGVTGKKPYDLGNLLDLNEP